MGNISLPSTSLHNLGINTIECNDESSHHDDESSHDENNMMDMTPRINMNDSYWDENEESFDANDSNVRFFPA